MAEDAKRVEEILAAVKPLAAEYYRLTRKPPGVTGEVAEYVAAQKLGLALAPPRASGYDAIRKMPHGDERIQIKGRAFGEDAKPSQRLGSIKPGAACDTVLLVILDNATLEPTGIWEAPYPQVIAKLAEPGSTARNVRGSLSIGAFKRIARPIWPTVSETSRSE